MKNGVYTVTLEQVSAWLDPELMQWAKVSRPLLVGMYKGEYVCIFGLIPTSFLSDSAYLWLWFPHIVPKVVFGRHAAKTMPKLLALYGKLICNCYSPDSARWLYSLGATRISPTLFEFHHG